MLWLRARLKQYRVVPKAAYSLGMIINSIRYSLLKRQPHRLLPTSISTTPTSKRFRMALCLRARDEGRFLPEWVAHHLGLGFEHIYVYDNGSTDESRQLLQPFISASLVTFLDWPFRPASPSCYYHFIDSYSDLSEWVGFLDADEFLIERSPGELSRVLHERRREPAIAINWRYFGSSGHKTIPNGFVTENFTFGDVAFDQHIKVIARPSEIIACHNSHNFYYKRCRTAMTPNGRRIFGSFAAPEAEPQLYINHYVYRSQQDYMRKARSGIRDVSGLRNMRTVDSLDREFARHNEAEFAFPQTYFQHNRRLLERMGFARAFWKSERTMVSADALATKE